MPLAVQSLITHPSVRKHSPMVLQVVPQVLVLTSICLYAETGMSRPLTFMLTTPAGSALPVCGPL
jgi:hypothetical protein